MAVAVCRVENMYPNVVERNRRLSAGITTNNGAVFWMSPGDGPHANAGAIPVAQVTIGTSSALNAAVFAL